MKNMEMVLAELGVPVDRARRFGSHIEYALNRFGIADTDTIAIFLANVLIETGGFSRLRENMNYTTVENLKRVFPSYFKTVDPKPYVSNPEKLANYVYANRNGNTQPGDGWRFRGGGMLQLTGRSQYNAANACLRGKFDIIKNPDDITTPRCAAVVSVQYFKMNHLDDLLRENAKKGPEMVCNRINTGRTSILAHQLNERMQLYYKALVALKGFSNYFANLKKEENDG